MSSESYRPIKQNVQSPSPQSNSGASQSPANQEKAPVNPNFSNPVESSMKIGGNIPESFKQMVVDQRVEERVEENTPDVPIDTKPQKEIKTSENNTLEEILASMNTNVFERIELPSRGVFYNGKDGPTDGVLHIREMTGAEEQILATPRLHRGNRAINMVFDNCIKEQYRSENFLSQDRTFVLIYLRGISYSPEYEVEIKDPDSNQTFMETINLDTDLSKNYCPENFGVSDLTDELPNTKLSFTYRLPTGKDEQNIIDYRDRMNKDFQRSNIADDTLIYKNSMLIEQLGGLTNKNEIKILLKRLPIQDLAYIRTVLDEPPFGVDTKVTIQNPYTFNEFTIDMPVDANFFLPRVKKKVSED